MSIDNYSDEAIGLRLTAVRKAAGLSKAEAADLLEFDRSGYIRIERGEKQLNMNLAILVHQRLHASLDFLYLGNLTRADQEVRDKLAELKKR